MYGVRGVNLAWFRSYLANRKQYISLGHDRKTDTQNILCAVPQGSILGPLLFLLYVNGLPNFSVLEPIMFADDTNLFFEQTDLRILVSMVTNKLKKIYEWFNANKLSLNADKTKYSLFHKPSKTDGLPLLLLKVLINDKEMERVGSIKFLGVLLDEHLSWKEHIRYTENKIAKNIGLLYRAKPFLGKHSLLTQYYSCIHTYLNYANLIWVSTNRTNLKKLQSQQKHAIRIVNNKTRFEHTKELFNSQKILKIYKLNILNAALFMHKIYNETAPATFFEPFQKVSHPYPTGFSKLCYKIPKTNLAKYKYRISSRGVLIWNNFLSDYEKQIESSSLFKSKVKLTLLAFENEITYF